MPSQQKRKRGITVFASCLLAVWWSILPSFLDAQILASEAFDGLPVPGYLVGSGASATGWSDSGWSGGNNTRFQIVSPLPQLTYQPMGGLVIQGGDRALQISTAPEPVPTGLVASRTILPQTGTLFVGCLFRITSLGTGTDSVDFVFSNGRTEYFRIALRPDPNGTLIIPNIVTSTGYSSSGSFNPNTTYYLLLRIARTTSTYIQTAVFVNPTTTPANPSLGVAGVFVPADAAISTIGLASSSSDTGGPATTLIIDELKVGYTWSDVLPSAPVQTVPSLTITPAVKIEWLSQAGKTYQPQSSYDLNSWINFGAAISGNGALKSAFDTTDQNAQKFYRVQVK